MDKPFLYVVCAALLDADNRILIQKRPEGKPWAGYWEFPGGKIESGETPEAALVRELKEELQIITFEKALFPITFGTYDYPEWFVVNMVYGCRNWTGTLIPQMDQETQWLKPARLHDAPMLPANKNFLFAIQALV